MESTGSSMQLCLTIINTPPSNLEPQFKEFFARRAAMHKGDSDYFGVHYEKIMEEMFAAVSDLYAEYCNDFFHFALFEDGTDDRDTAFERTHRKYMGDLNTGSAGKILVLACGRGGFSNIIAQNTRGEVLGIDISRSQLSHAKRLERENLRFKHHDIMKVDELNDTYDAAVCLDAGCYLPDKKLAVEKIAEVLNPGARFLLVDWCRQEDVNRLQHDLVLQPFMKYWAIPGLETMRAYEGYLKQSGLALISVQDLSEKVRKNWEFGYQMALRAVKGLSMEHLPSLIWKGAKLGPGGVSIIKEQFPAALYIKAAFDSGMLQYAYFLAEKEKA
jgi:SAM-dependent methyltransferase